MNDDRLHLAPSPFASVLLFSVAALAVFALCYPTHFLIADEVAYFEQACAWTGNNAGGELPPIAGDYPPGTALPAAAGIALFGPKAVFWTGTGAWLVGIWALALLLHRLEKPVIWALYPALFLPGLVLTRTLMSDLPSFALASIFLWLYTPPKKNQSTSQPSNPQPSSLPTFQPATFQPSNLPAFQLIRLAAAGLVAGLGLLFRETNVLWALPFLLGAALRGRTSWGILWLGFAAGMAPRLAWGWFFFGDPLFVRDSGIAFSIAFLPKNLMFYVPALLVLVPGGLYFLWKNRSPYRWEIAATVGLFLAVYGCYGYDAFSKSGYKAVVLQGRFLLPLLPFVALAAAETMPRVSRRFQIGMGVAAFALFVGVQMLGYGYNSRQQRITDALLQLPTATHYTFTPDESHKYLNALHGHRQLIALPTTQNSKPKTQNCYAHLITRSESADWRKKTGEAETAFERYFRGRDTQLVCDLTIEDGTRLRIWRVQSTKKDE
ncbi:MAG: hypothetical protein IPM98_14800 [Lewinellaceae bacterium]|nr:hypothetical protein [Lewinellaceae bacterium]